MRIRFVIFAAVAMLGLVSCNAIGDAVVSTSTLPGNGVTTTAAAPTTTADGGVTPVQPPTTVVPDLPLVPEDGDGVRTVAPPWWLLVVVAVAFLILVLAFVARGSRKKIVIATPPRTWKENAISGYTHARWLYDSMSEDLAIWRGNATFDNIEAVGMAAGTALASTWEDLDGRLARASDNLYALEAAAPDQKTALVANETIATMRAVRYAVDARAEARMNYRRIEAQSDIDSLSLREGREREVRAARNLAESRSAYGRSLTNLSTIV